MMILSCWSKPRQKSSFSNGIPDYRRVVNAVILIDFRTCRRFSLDQSCLIS
jgi:hypothetical protein